MKRGVILGVALAALVVTSSAGIAAAVVKQSPIERLVQQIRLLKDAILSNEAQIRLLMMEKNYPAAAALTAQVAQERAALATLEQELNDIYKTTHR